MRKRNKTITIRVTEDEWCAIMKQVLKAGMNVTDYLVTAATTTQIYVTEDTKPLITEQTELQATISEYGTQKTKQSEAVDNIQRHIELVEKYTDIKHLNARILNRLIDRIEVSQRGKDKDGCPTQMITIYFRFIGKAELELMDMISPALIAG